MRRARGEGSASRHRVKTRCSPWFADRHGRAWAAWRILGLFDSDVPLSSSKSMRPGVDVHPGAPSMRPRPAPCLPSSTPPFDAPFSSSKSTPPFLSSATVSFPARLPALLMLAPLFSLHVFVCFACVQVNTRKKPKREEENSAAKVAATTRVDNRTPNFSPSSRLHPNTTHTH